MVETTGAARISRRMILGFTVVGAGALALPSATPARAPIDPVTALTVTSTVLSAARSFSAPGGGLEAMMQAQNAKLNLIIEQLGQIQTSLASMQLQISELPTIITGLLRSQYRDQLIASLGGAAERFATNSRSRTYDPGYHLTAPAQAELSNILYTATQQRATLAQLPEGRGPEAAAILSLALGLEVATLALTGHGRARILAALDAHEGWIAQMRSADLDGSIWRVMAEHVSSHDGVIDEMAATQLGRNFALHNARMGATNPTIDGRARDVCSVLCALAIQGPNPTAPLSAQVASNLASVCPIGWGVETRIGVREDPVLGVQMLSYDKTWEGVVAPWEKDSCTTQVMTPYYPNMRAAYLNGQITDAQIRSRTAAMHSRFDGRRAAFVALLDKANFHRARVGQCALAMTLLNQAEDQIRLYRTLSS